APTAAASMPSTLIAGAPEPYYRCTAATGEPLSSPASVTRPVSRTTGTTASPRVSPGSISAKPSPASSSTSRSQTAVVTAAGPPAASRSAADNVSVLMPYQVASGVSESRNGVKKASCGAGGPKVIGARPTSSPHHGRPSPATTRSGACTATT